MYAAFSDSPQVTLGLMPIQWIFHGKKRTAKMELADKCANNCPFSFAHYNFYYCETSKKYIRKHSWKCLTWDYVEDVK